MKIDVVTPSEKIFSGNLIIFSIVLCLRSFLPFLSFSNFLSGRIKAHFVFLGTLFNTFSTIVKHPYFVSNGGFISTFVIFLDLIQSQASFVLLSRCSRFVFPSLWINIFAQASAKISLSNSIPYNWVSLIWEAFFVLMPPASFIILHIAFTKNAPEPQAASNILSFWLTSINLYIKDVIWSGVKTWPLSDFFLYRLNSLKKIPITSSPFQ